MASKELKTQILQDVALEIQTIAADTTTDGEAFDMTLHGGFEGITFIMQTGVVTAGDVTMNIQESDDAITYSDVAAANLVGDEETLDGSHETTRISYIGKKRYVMPQFVTDNSANLIVGAIGIKTHPRKAETD